MKQRITVEQLNELTPEKKEKLREWWSPRIGDMYVFISLSDKYIELLDNVKEFIKNKNWLPLLSIGQCIELLTQEGNIDIHYQTGKIDIYFLNPTELEGELIDALFAAVKEAL